MRAAMVAVRRVKTTGDGMQAVVKLGGGDMRKTLNILQVGHVGLPTVYLAPST